MTADTKSLLAHVQRLLTKLNDQSVDGVQTEAGEILRTHFGERNEFYRVVTELKRLGTSSTYRAEVVRENLKALSDAVESGAVTIVSPKRQAQLDITSDYLSMAADLLEDDRVHPAAPAVLIGATLEEFLRTWIEAAGLSIGSRKPGIETYSQTLRESDRLTRQDGKDITSWAGTRNDAAHGDWDKVKDRDRVRIMLEGVNLFLRRYADTSGS